MTSKLKIHVSGRSITKIPKKMKTVPTQMPMLQSTFAK